MTPSVYWKLNRVSVPGGVFQQQLYPRRELQLLGTSRVNMFAGSIREDCGERRCKIGGVMIIVQDIAAGDDIDCNIHDWITSSQILCLSFAVGECFQCDDIGRLSDVVHVEDAGDVERDVAFEAFDIEVLSGEPRA